MTFVSEQFYKDQDYTKIPLSSTEFENCTFNSCNFSSLDLKGFSFENCTFISCDLSNIKVRGVSFQKVKFEQCKMLGIHFNASNPFLLEFFFKNCQLDYCSFYNLKIKKTEFINCRLTEVDFTQADLSDSDFQESNLMGSIFDLTIAERVDFRNSLNLSMDPEKNRIRGAHFDLDSLPGLLGKYRIKIG